MRAGEYRRWWAWRTVALLWVLAACGGRATLDDGSMTGAGASSGSPSSGATETGGGAPPPPLCLPACEGAAAACELSVSVEGCVAQCASRPASCGAQHDELLQCIIEGASEGSCDMPSTGCGGDRYFECVGYTAKSIDCGGHHDPGEPCLCHVRYRNHRNKVAELSLTVDCVPVDDAGSAYLCDCTADGVWLGRCLEPHVCYSDPHCCAALVVLHGLP
jgi:hypothetical protein